MRLRHSIASGITATLTAVSIALGLGAAVPAAAAPTGNVVVFGDRWVSGSIDTATANYTMSLHPSHAGSAFVAGEVARAL